MSSEQKMNKKKFWRKENIIGFSMIAVAALFFMPIYYMLINAIKPNKEVLLRTIEFPKGLYLDSFITIWQKTSFLNLLKNSVIITVLSIIGIVLFSSMAGYMIARKNTRFTKTVYLYLLLSIVIPFQAIMIPLVKLMAFLHITNNIYGLVLVYICAATPMSVFLYAGAVRCIPRSIEEAARIDGANWFMTFWRIIFPLLRSITSTVVILNSFWIWNDFLLPLIMLTSNENKTIPVGLMSLIFGQYGPNVSVGLAAAIFSVIPMLIIYLSLQKYFIKGLIEGSVKG
ncbi:MAG: carbohydrate ABC transporter permease [Clostridia bacterium]